MTDEKKYGDGAGSMRHEAPLLAPEDAEGDLLFGGPDPADMTEEAARTHGRNTPARDQRSLRARVDATGRVLNLREEIKEHFLAINTARAVLSENVYKLERKLGRLLDAIDVDRES